MAEAIPSSVADRVLERLNSEAVQLFCSICGLNSQLLHLKHTISSIRLRLPAAELALSPSSSVLNLIDLDLIQDAIFEADDLLDIIFVEAQRHQLRPGNKILKQVCTFFSNSSNPVGFFFNMGYKLRKINKKLAKFDTQEHNIQALSTTEANNEEDNKENHSFELGYEVVGREDDKMELIELLLDTQITDDCDNVSVISIVGPGGLGKTTLANLVFNDETILNHFELRMWVCVSEYLDLRFVAEKIIRSLTGKYLEGDIEIDQLQKIVHKKMNGKRFLLVVDDLQDHVNETEWLSLKKLVSNGAKGSGIIVTTRSETVLKVTSTNVVYELGELDVEQSWSLFKRIAFVRGQEPTNRSIKEIGLKIVRKCSRNPLAIITIGSMLYFKDQAEWSSLFENELLKIVSQGQDSSGSSDVLPILKVSYDHLPSHLKHCFAYCSLFPRDHDFNVQALVNLWMAQEFIKLSDNTTKYFEDVGYDYFMVLLWRSFFHEAKKDKWGNVMECKIPNLMHDLANLVTGWQCARLDLNGKCIHPITHDLDLKRIQYQSRDVHIPGKKKKTILLPEFMDHERTHHVSLHFNLDSPWHISSLLVQAKKIRTFLVHNELPWKMEGRMGKSNCDAVISSFKSLRVLDLHNSGIETLSNSICKLKHLRYLDLSNNFDIKLLPTCITMLQNLETLKLSYCRKLKELPRDIKKLVNLKHLEIDGCCSLTYMPRGLGQLTCLQTLSEFVLIKDAASWSKHYCAKLGELMKLNNLRGELRIKNLRLGMDDHAAANLKEKHHLRSLTLIWDVDEKHNEVINESQEGLQLHPNLEELIIYGYKGAEFSFLLPSLKNLVKLSLRNCMKCQHLPTLYKLQSLEVLVLDEMHALEYISDGNETLSSSKQLLSSLKEVRLTDLPKLKGWWMVEVDAADAEDDKSVGTRSISQTSDNQSLASFSRLSKLIIEDCPQLISMPLYPSLEELLLLGNASWKTLQNTMMNDVENSSFSPLSKLRVLCIVGMSELDICNDDAVLWQNFTSLQALKLDRLSNLSSLPDGLQYVCALQELYIQHCSGFMEIPEWICNLKTLEKLVILDCPNLTSLPDRMLQLTSSSLALEIEDCPKLGHVQNMTKH